MQDEWTLRAVRAVLVGNQCCSLVPCDINIFYQIVNDFHQLLMQFAPKPLCASILTIFNKLSLWIIKSIILKTHFEGKSQSACESPESTDIMVWAQITLKSYQKQCRFHPKCKDRSGPLKKTCFERMSCLRRCERHFSLNFPSKNNDYENFKKP